MVTGGRGWRRRERCLSPSTYKLSKEFTIAAGLLMPVAGRGGENKDNLLLGLVSLPAGGELPLEGGRSVAQLLPLFPSSWRRCAPLSPPSSYLEPLVRRRRVTLLLYKVTGNEDEAILRDHEEKKEKEQQSAKGDL